MGLGGGAEGGGLLRFPPAPRGYVHYFRPHPARRPKQLRVRLLSKRVEVLRQKPKATRGMAPTAATADCGGSGVGGGGKSGSGRGGESGGGGGGDGSGGGSCTFDGANLRLCSWRSRSTALFMVDVSALALVLSLALVAAAVAGLVKGVETDHEGLATGEL